MHKRKININKTNFPTKANLYMILEWTTYKHVSARKKLDRILSIAIICKIVQEPSDLVLEEFYLLEKIQIPFFYRCVIITCSLVLTTIIKLQGTYQICSCWLIPETIEINCFSRETLRYNSAFLPNILISWCAILRKATVSAKFWAIW